MRVYVFTSERDPVPYDADHNGQVLTFNSEDKKYIMKNWFDFPSHPFWTDEQRKQITKKYPFWITRFLEIGTRAWVKVNYPHKKSVHEKEFLGIFDGIGWKFEHQGWFHRNDVIVIEIL